MLGLVGLVTILGRDKGIHRKRNRTRRSYNDRFNPIKWKIVGRIASLTCLKTNLLTLLSLLCFDKRQNFHTKPPFGYLLGIKITLEFIIFPVDRPLAYCYTCFRFEFSLAESTTGFPSVRGRPSI